MYLSDKQLVNGGHKLLSAIENNARIACKFISPRTNIARKLESFIGQTKRKHEDAILIHYELKINQFYAILLKK